MVAFIMRMLHGGLVLCLSLVGQLYPGSAFAQFMPVNLACVAVNSPLVLPVQQVFHTTPASDLQYDPTQLSLLIAVALQQRYGSSVPLRDIASLISARHAGQSYSFLDIKRVLQAAGHSVSAYRISAEATQLPAAGDVGFLMDPVVSVQGNIITLLFAAGAGNKYLLYANGIICPMPEQVFEQRFMNSVFLRLD